MAQSECKITMTVKIALWLRLYLYGVVVMAALTKRQPNFDKVQYWIDKGISVKAL